MEKMISSKGRASACSISSFRAFFLPYPLHTIRDGIEISTVISIVVAASAALLQFYKFQDHIIFNHTAAEKMQLEYSHYLTDRGEYADLSSGEALDRFMDEIDKLRQETNELSLSMEKSAQDQKLDQIEKLSKSTHEIHQVKDAQ